MHIGLVFANCYPSQLPCF